MGRRLHLNPLIMLVGFFGGVMTMGVVGFVLGPVIIVLFFTGLRIFLAERKSAQQPPGMCASTLNIAFFPFA